MSVVKANTYQDASGGSNAVFSGVASPPNGINAWSDSKGAA